MCSSWESNAKCDLDSKRWLAGFISAWLKVFLTTFLNTHTQILKKKNEIYARKSWLVIYKKHSCIMHSHAILNWFYDFDYHTVDGKQKKSQAFVPECAKGDTKAMAHRLIPLTMTTVSMSMSKNHSDSFQIFSKIFRKCQKKIFTATINPSWRIFFHGRNKTL